MTDPCPYDPRELAGQPIGMFNCPLCGEMVLAGMVHTPPSADPCFEKDGKFWFWDEVWMDKHGPYATGPERDAAFVAYGKYLDEGSKP